MVQQSEQRGEGLTRPLFIVGGAIDHPESPLGGPCGGEVKLNKLAVSNNVRLTITIAIKLCLYYNANNTRARKTHTVATPPRSRREGSWELVFSVDERLSCRPCLLLG